MLCGRKKLMILEMDPYSTLMITFIVEEQGTYQAVQFFHQMITKKGFRGPKPEKIKEVLERATGRFDRSATLQKAPSRHFPLKEKDSSRLWMHRGF